jgi:hypothetical protein
MNCKEHQAMKNEDLMVSKLKKSCVFAGLLSAFSLAHANCAIASNYYQAPVGEVLRKGWNFPNYDLVCNKLSQAGAKLSILGMSNVIDGKTVAWAALSVEDKATGLIVESFSSAQTRVSDIVSHDENNVLLHVAINDAANNWSDLDAALKTLDEQRQKLTLTQKR